MFLIFKLSLSNFQLFVHLFGLLRYLYYFFFPSPRIVQRRKNRNSKNLKDKIHEPSICNLRCNKVNGLDLSVVVCHR